MGVGIATQAALHGYPTIVHDIDAARLASVHGKAEAILDELIDAGVFNSGDKQQVLARIETTDQLARVATAGFIVEAIPEVLELKSRTYRALEPLLRDDAIFASNTSGFPPDLLAQALQNNLLGSLGSDTAKVLSFLVDFDSLANLGILAAGLGLR